MGFFLLDLLTLGAVNAMLILGFNLQYGYTGILNFTFYTFAAIGAYFTAVTTMGNVPPTMGSEQYILHWALPWPLGLLMGGIAAMLLGLVVMFVAVRRLRSDYLAIVSISVGLIVWTITDAKVGLFNGDNGIFGVPQIVGNMPVSQTGYTAIMAVVSLIILAFFYWISRRIFKSPYGRVLRSIREDEVLAETHGKNVFSNQVWIFMIGSFFGGVAGGLLVQYVSAFNPQGFLPAETFVLLAGLIIGGSGNYKGSILGAFLVIEFLLEISRFLPTFGRPDLVGAFRQILIGVALIVILRYLPGGLLPEWSINLYRSAKDRVTGRGSEPWQKTEM